MTSTTRLHKDINIKENVTTRTDVYWPKVLTRLQAGSGTDDIQAIEVMNITEAVQTQAGKFVDLGKEVDKSQWLDWKNAQATSQDGKLIGLGTDIGPMAICYRKDLFEKAGLETDRTKLAEQWKGDWSKYVDLGKQYMKKAPGGTKFVDSASLGLQRGPRRRGTSGTTRRTAPSSGTRPRASRRPGTPPWRWPPATCRRS